MAVCREYLERVAGFFVVELEVMRTCPSLVTAVEVRPLHVCMSSVLIVKSQVSSRCVSPTACRDLGRGHPSVDEICHRPIPAHHRTDCVCLGAESLLFVCVCVSLSLSFPTLPPLLQSLPLCGPPQLKELFLAFAYTMQHYNFNIAPLHEYLENIHVHFDKVMLQRTRMMLDAV